jgi:isopenicillin-N epimerase
MVAIPLPLVDPIALGERLYQEYRIEVPLTEHLGQQAVRVSVQGYTTDQDLDALVAALTEEIPN